mmetsp:Transcript_18327/g.45500  ORF Transcript_18327/g.45500 Transcript_18327/m.45500 type:complete len:98 (-) Transcript_18327:245-538(-)
MKCFHKRTLENSGSQNNSRKKCAFHHNRMDGTVPFRLSRVTRVFARQMVLQPHGKTIDRVKARKPSNQLILRSCKALYSRYSDGLERVANMDIVSEK